MVALARPGGAGLPRGRVISSSAPHCVWPQGYCSAPFVPEAPQLLMLLAFLALSKALRNCLLGKRGFRGTMSCLLCRRLCRKTADRCSPALHMK